MRKSGPPDEDWSARAYAKLMGFVATWKSFQGTEQSGAQDFLRGLLDIYEVDARPGMVFEQHPVRTPARNNHAAQGSLFSESSHGEYTTERMDMYLPKVCVWEMKGPSEKDLGRHHEQLLGYWARMRTRYMVLCNFHEFWIYDTNDESGQLVPRLKFQLGDLPANGDALLFLRGDEPEFIGRSERVTSQVAAMLGRLVRDVIESSPDPERDRERIAKLILECVFAMFAEDTELIPKNMFTEAMRRADTAGELDAVWSLFDDFARKDPGDRGNRLAPYVNGPLFDRNHPKLKLSSGQVHDLHCAARDFDWQDVRPEIFGSIFEQALNPVERHELGAHFTRESDIARVVGPTIIEPWRERIGALRTPKDAARAVEEMRRFQILDPACGCGNFLYVAYREMKRLEAALADKWVSLQRGVAKRKADIQPPPPRPWFTIEQLHGMEINTFASFLARVVLWIGEHLAKRELGTEEENLPLKNLDANIRTADALLTDWPRPPGELAIVGNPPYLGVRKLRRELGDDRVDELFARFPKNRSAAYVTYWFTRALDTLRPGERAGYVATNSIAQNEGREASLDPLVKRGGTITDGWKSYPWPGEAAVHISIVNWLMAPYDGIRTLDGKEVSAISTALVAAEASGGTASDITMARRLPKNEDLCFMGVTPGNKEFVLTDEQRAEILAADAKSKSVIRPFLIGRDVNREIDQKPTRWIIDFGTMTKEQAEAFPGAMRHVRRHVYPSRQQNPREAKMKTWWSFWRPATDLRRAIEGRAEAIVLPRVSPRLITSRQEVTICFDCQLIVVALSDAYHFGILSSRHHALWARARGSTLKGDLRYTNTTIFETFPFPPLPGGRYDPRQRPKTKEADRVAAAAAAFDEARSAACRDQKLGLTKIHNQLEAGKLPELRVAYDALNDAVTACYGFPEGSWRDDTATLRRLLTLNHHLVDSQQA